jgi:hypothetical protein
VVSPNCSRYSCTEFNANFPLLGSFQFQNPYRSLTQVEYQAMAKVAWVGFVGVDKGQGEIIPLFLFATRYQHDRTFFCAILLSLYNATLR